MPCYNEGKSLPHSIPPLCQLLDKLAIDCEVVLVDNGSADDTGAVINNLRAQYPRISKAIVEKNQGYGFGITTGMKAARGEIIGYMCADGQIEAEDVVRTIWAMDKLGKGHVSKVRRVTRDDGFIRWMVSRFYNGLFLAMFGVATTDVNGTPKWLHRDDLAAINPASKDWFIDAEVMIGAKRGRLTVVEVPVNFLKRKQGKSRVRFMTCFEFLKNMLRERFRRGR